MFGALTGPTAPRTRCGEPTSSSGSSPAREGNAGRWHPRGLGPCRGVPHTTPAPTCAGGGRAGGRWWCGAGAEGSPRGGLGSLLPRWPGVRARGCVPRAGSGVAERGPPGAALVSREHPGPRLSQPPGWGCGGQPWGRAGQSQGGAGGPPQVPLSAHWLWGAGAGMGTLGWPCARGVGDGDSAQWDRLAVGWSELCARGRRGSPQHWLSPCVGVCCPRPCPHCQHGGQGNGGHGWPRAEGAGRRGGTLPCPGQPRRARPRVCGHLGARCPQCRAMGQPGPPPRAVLAFSLVSLPGNERLLRHGWGCVAVPPGPSASACHGGFRLQGCPGGIPGLQRWGPAHEAAAPPALAPRDPGAARLP